MRSESWLLELFILLGESESKYPAPSTKGDSEMNNNNHGERKMRNRISREEAVKRAAEDFKALILYYNVTRPQKLPYFKKDGKFSIKEFKRQINFGGKTMGAVKRMNLDNTKNRQFRACQAHYNYTFGIPRERINAVLRFYRDNDGRQIRIKIQDVLPIVEADIGKLTQKAHGEAWGEYSYCSKWIMDETIRDKYLKDRKWSDIFIAPGVSDYFKKLVNRWIKEDMERNNKKQTEDKDMTVDELKDEMAKEAAMDNTILPDVPVKVDDDIYADIPPETPKQEVVPVKSETIKVETKPIEKVEIKEPPKVKEQLTKIQTMRLDTYIERFKSGVLSKETFRKYLKEEFGNVLEATKEYIMANIRG